MTFKVIDKKTGTEPTGRVIQNIAKKGGLILNDIDQFFLGEDGSILLMDDCGNCTYCDNRRFKVEVENERLLSEAITRYAKFIRDYSSIVDGRIYYDIIKKYVEEIKMISQAEKKLLKMDKETKKE